MTHRPYVLLSAAQSVDGYLDGPAGPRLVLSNTADLDRVDEVRAGSDAILVGANTIRRDNARLLVRSADRRAARVAKGLPDSPVKVTITGSGDLSPTASFFTTGTTAKIVYAAGRAVAATQERFSDVATVVDAGQPVDLRAVLADLAARGVGRLLVEGGGTVHTQLLAAGLADEINLAIAPFFVGSSAAPRFVGDGPFPNGPTNRMVLHEVRPIGDVVLLRYLTHRGEP